MKLCLLNYLFANRVSQFHKLHHNKMLDQLHTTLQDTTDHNDEMNNTRDTSSPTS